MDRSYRQFINWIFESTALVVLAVVLGSYLDKKLQTGANILSLLLLFAFCIEGWNLHKIYKRAVEIAEEKNKKNSEPKFKK